MEIRLMLDCIEIGGIKHGIAKLSNGRYAVGQLQHGMQVPASKQFPCLDTAFTHWYATLPSMSVEKKAA